MASQYKNFDELPESVQEALLSPETIEAIHGVGAASNLSEDKIHSLAEIITDTFIDPSEEANLVSRVKKLGLDDKATDEVIKNLLEKVINPIKSSANSDSQLKIVEEVASLRPIFAPPPVIPQKQQEPPTPRAQEEAEPTHEAPFILHQEEEIEPTKEATKTQYNTQRPAFYKPTFSEEYKKSMLGSEAARIELGEEPAPREPKPGKTKNQETRIVHYSEFRTPLDPFSGTQEQQAQTSPTEVKKNRETPEVHPNNVVDLKDLPLE